MRSRFGIILLMHASNDLSSLASNIKNWGAELGFQAIGVSDVDLSTVEPGFVDWLRRGLHGEMDYMKRHGTARSRPGELVPGTIRVIAARMNYFPASADASGVLADGQAGYVARYALGRDYHKVMRSRLANLVGRIGNAIGDFGYRVFSDSAPVMEVELARKAGLGWRGKHTLLLSRDAGSYFFLGEIYTDLPLPVDTAASEHCGSCSKCIDVCPTKAILAPYLLDARRCISYLTIELKGTIPVELRGLIGNRVYGCDDCQIFCPWNSFAQVTQEKDFEVRNGLDCARLVELFSWTEQEFDARLAGAAIRRIGHERWLRNIAVGLGNAPTSDDVLDALGARADHPSPMVREHVAWALDQHAAR